MEVNPTTVLGRTSSPASSPAVAIGDGAEPTGGMRRRPLRVAVVSKADSRGGGASRVACDIAENMPSSECEVAHLVAWSATGYDDVRRPAYGPAPLRRSIDLLGKVSRRAGMAELVPFELPSVLAALAAGGYDLVHVHDTSSAFSPLTLMAIASRYPVIWTFHDCSPFTGGCLYPQTSGCVRFVSGCGACPQKGEWPLDGRFDSTRLSLRMKTRLHAAGRVVAAAPSHWMADEAYASGHLPRRPVVVSNMVDTDLFRPASSRASAKARLSLPAERPVLAVSSGNVSDPRKDVASAMRTAAAMAERGPPPKVVLIGVPHPSVGDAFPGVDVVSTGYVTDRTELAEWLAACDAFVFTSKADNQPLAVLEALACGTPVYGWPTGGVAEILEDGTVGGSVASGDVAALAASMSEDRFSGAMERKSGPARRLAVERFGRDRFVRDHLRLYRDVVERYGASK